MKFLEFNLDPNNLQGSIETALRMLRDSNMLTFIPGNYKITIAIETNG